jgi:hypothetical protein
MSQVVVADWVSAIVVANGDASAVFFGMAIVAAENDDRVFPLIGFVEFLEDATDLPVNGFHDPGVRLAGHFEIGIGLFEFLKRLFGVVGEVEGHGREKGSFSVYADVFNGFVNYHDREILVSSKDFLVVVIEIVIPLTV